MNLETGEISDDELASTTDTTVPFSTNMFSIYTLSYKDTVSEDDGNGGGSKGGSNNTSTTSSRSTTTSSPRSTTSGTSSTARKSTPSTGDATSLVSALGAMIAGLTLGVAGLRRRRS